MRAQLIFFLNFIAVFGCVLAVDESSSPVITCFDDCAKQFDPRISKPINAACRHGCRYAQFTYGSASQPSDSPTASPFHTCYSYCLQSYPKAQHEQEACLYSCKGTDRARSPNVPVEPPPANQTKPEKCTSKMYGKMDEIKCMAYMVMWQFNYETNKCEQFVYGGCPELLNKFETFTQCEAECGKFASAHFGHNHHQDVTVARSVKAEIPKCLSPTYDVVKKLADIECDNFRVKYQFNSEEGLCESFMYGGCPDLANMFDSQPECQSQCSAFTLPPTTTTTTSTTTERTTTATSKPVPAKDKTNSANNIISFSTCCYLLSLLLAFLTTTTTTRINF